MVSGLLFFKVRSQKTGLEDNLNQSRAALQAQLAESAKLKSRALEAEESNKRTTRLAEEEQTIADGLKEQFDGLKQRAEESEAAQKRANNEVSMLSATNRDLQRQINNLKASIPPQNWREELNQLQSRLLELEAENTSLRRSLDSSWRNSQSQQSSSSTPSSSRSTGLQPIGEVVRIGPDGSFAIISYGRHHGAAEGQTLSLWREQQKIALVSLTQITNDFSIAQILSSTNTGSNLSVPDIQVGDTAHLE